MKYSNNTQIIFQAPRTLCPCFASRYMSTGIRIFQYSVCQYSSFSPTLWLSSTALSFLSLKACMTASIPHLDWFDRLWQVHIHTHISQLHCINNADPRLTTSQTLRRKILLLKNSKHSSNTQTTLQSPSKLSGQPPHALQLDRYPLASGYSNTLFASTAPPHLL